MPALESMSSSADDSDSDCFHFSSDDEEHSSPTRNTGRAFFGSGHDSAHLNFNFDEVPLAFE
jgi:hypothetical protein